MTDFQSGLLISVVGLLSTFSALLIFIGVIIGLQKLFPVKEKKFEAVAPVEAAEPAEAVTKAETNAEEIAAAVAAVAVLRAQRSGQLGASLVSGPGPYRMFKMVDRKK